MSTYLILTSAEAHAIRTPLASVEPQYEPILRAGDKWILPASILESPNHTSFLQTLSNCPQLTLDDAAFPPELEEL